ncbi:Voltage-dependent anion channel [Fragilaria crotonensis]|nr:Voltage-dependent anion channel [Fragilaria crotonensis]
MTDIDFIPSTDSIKVDADCVGDSSLSYHVANHATVTATGVEVMMPHDEAEVESHNLKTSDYPSVWLRIPNTSFGIPMGLAGHAMMWKAAGDAEFINEKVNAEQISAVFWIASLLLGAVFLTAYCFKAYRFFPLVMDECRDGARMHFLNMPHLIVLMLTICVPENSSHVAIMVGNGELFRSIVFGISALIQLSLTQYIGERWLFSDNQHTVCGPPFLISLVAWFLLSVLGTQANIDQHWGIALPTFCFGVGTIMYFVSSFVIFNGMRSEARGSPALFLIMTPPSIAMVAWDMISSNPGVFAILSKLILGCCLVFFLFLVRIGQQLSSPPPSFGFYWAYVFPVSALATGCAFTRIEFYLERLIGEILY